MSGALTHFLEEAARRQLPRFEAWFPSSFDWMRLCADVPDMAARRAQAEAPNRALEEGAAAVFSAAHLLGLAVLSAAFSEGEDPAVLLERLTTAPDEDEEARFDALVAGCLDALEVRLSTPDGEAPASAAEAGDSAAADRAEALALVVWPAVKEALAADEARVFEHAGADADLLWSLSLVAVVLAAFRWMAAEEHAPDWPRPALGV